MRCVQNVILENVGGGRRFTVSKGENVLIKGGWWGNYATSGEQDIMLGGGGRIVLRLSLRACPGNVTLDAVTIRDVFWGVKWDTDMSHPDCLQINDVEDLTVRRSRFVRCGQVFIGYYGDGNLRGALIENNVFAKIGADAFFTSQFNDTGKPGRCGDIVFRNNTYDDSGGNTIKGYGFPYFSCRGGKVRVVNNIFHTTPRSDACGLNGSQWTNNVYELASVSHDRRFVCGRLARLAGAGDADLSTARHRLPTRKRLSCARCWFDRGLRESRHSRAPPGRGTRSRRGSVRVCPRSTINGALARRSSTPGTPSIVFKHAPRRFYPLVTGTRES